jgi:hypothetical protein
MSYTTQHTIDALYRIIDRLLNEERPKHARKTELVEAVVTLLDAAAMNWYLLVPAGVDRIAVCRTKAHRDAPPSSVWAGSGFWSGTGSHTRGTHAVVGVDDAP